MPPINFFQACCETTTTNKLFGICDSPPPPHNPAYLNYDEVAKPDWIAEVKNDNSVEVIFTAIDNCIVIKRADGTDESRCDCMLRYDNSIIFVELKDRMSKGWLGKAKNQLLITISTFMVNHNNAVYANKRAHIANAQRPFFQSGYQNVIDEIKTLSGCITEVKTLIEIK
jgi:hypothetical protein